MDQIKINDGEELFFYYKEYIERIRPTAEALKDAFEAVSEFQKPLIGSMLSEIVDNKDAFFDKMVDSATAWANKQGGIQRAGLLQSCNILIEDIRVALAQFEASIKDHRVYNGKRFPADLVTISGVSQFFFGKINDIGSVKHLFAEYLTSKYELDFYNCMLRLAQANNEAAKMAKHWTHELNPTPAFLDYDHADKLFKPKIEFIKNYLS